MYPVVVLFSLLGGFLVALYVRSLGLDGLDTFALTVTLCAAWGMFVGWTAMIVEKL